MNLETIVPILALVIGWFVNSWLNRKHEINKKRMELRLDMFREYIDYFEELVSSQEIDSKKLNHVLNLFELYGNDDEIKLVKTVSDLINKKKEKCWQTKYIKLNVLVIKNLRKELQFPK